MKKLTLTSVLTLFAILMLFLNSIYVVFADGGPSFQNEDLIPLDKFEITDGLNLSKGTESTFDKERTISGVAEKDTEVVIVVYSVIYDKETEDYVYEERNKYELKVGASGLFSETVEFEIGVNYVEVTAVKGNKGNIAGAVVKCKDEGVKLELENGRAIPGKSAAKTA